MKMKQPILGYRHKSVKLFNLKAKGLRKYIGVGLLIYAALPVCSFWAAFPAVFLLSGISLKTKIKSWKYELITIRRLRWN